MEELKAMSLEAYTWLEQLPPNTLVRGFQRDLPKCDILLNNNCEVFNKYILEARKMHLKSMIEKINTQLMVRFYNKRKEAENWLGSVCPK